MPPRPCATVRPVWLFVILLVPAAAGQDTLYAHADGDELFLSPDPEDPRAEDELAAGDAADGTVRWSFDLDPPSASVWRLDGARNVTAAIGIGSSTVWGDVEVSWTLASGSVVVARGAAQTVSYTVGYETLFWDVAPEAADHDPRRGPLLWNITARGTLPTMVFVSVAGDDRSIVTLPIGERVPIVNVPPREHENVTGARVVVDWDIPTPTDRIRVYHWEPPGRFTVRGAAALENGTATALLADANGTVHWETAWPEPGNATAAVQNATGNWSLELRFDQAVGTLSVTMERDDPPRATTSTTGRRSPGVGALAGLVVLAWAAVRR